MGTYTAGDETRRQIIETCKVLFYLKGLKATGYDDICEKAKVNRGLIPYHFKGKDYIAAIIFTELCDRINNEFREIFQDKNKNERFAAVELALFREAIRNKNFGRFYSETENSNDCYETTLNQQIQLIRELLDYNNLTMDEEAIKTIGCILEGTERELIINIYNGYLTESIDTIVMRDVDLVFTLLGFDHVEINKIFQGAVVMADSCDFRVLENFETIVKMK